MDFEKNNTSSEFYYKWWQRFQSVHKAHRAWFALGLLQSSASKTKVFGRIIQTLWKRSSTNRWFCSFGGIFDLLYFFTRHMDYNVFLNWCH